jgi:hypothetical protein
VPTKTLSNQPHLFADLRDVASRENITQTYHPAVKYGGHPVIQQEAPWERHDGMTASVIYDEEDGLFKAWYMAGHPVATPGAHDVQTQCLATSQDGIHWERPKLGLHSALGSKENNIVIPAEYHDGMDHWETMLKDPVATDPTQKYKALGWSSYDWDGPLAGIYTATSPDGLNWTHTPEPVFRYHPRPGTNDMGPIGDAQALMVDTRKRRYIAFLRGVDGGRHLSISEDFDHWTQPQPFMYPLSDEETLYNNVGFVYGDQYLGFLTHFNRHALHQTQTLQLLTSRDGEHWMRAPAEQPIIGLSDIGEWDRFQIMLTGAPPIRVGDKLYIYYRGTNRRHAKVPSEFEPRIGIDQEKRTMSIGLATLRLDGFASMDGSFDGGIVVTRPVLLGGDNLALNVKCDYGQAQVELLDEQDQPIPGYTRQDCVPLKEDNVEARIVWQERNSLAELKDRPVKLKFYLRNARLYSYRCL